MLPKLVFLALVCLWGLAAGMSLMPPFGDWQLLIYEFQLTATGPLMLTQWPSMNTLPESVAIKLVR